MKTPKCKIKKSQFSKRSKKAWRTTDIKDVENFYENKLLEERLGGPFSEKADNELFIIQKEPEREKKKLGKRKASGSTTREEKRKRLLEEPPRSHASLINTSKVPDPITKRNRVRTKEERKSAIRRDIEMKLRERGIFKKKEKMAINHRIINLKRKKALSKRKPRDFCNDLWNEKKDKEVKINEEEKNEWLSEDTVRHYVTNTGQLEVKTPNSTYKKPSSLPNIEIPHPGMSYNPSKDDHKKLLSVIADTENKMIKAEEHVKRVTTGMFKKIPREEVEKNWMEAMSQGLSKDNGEEQDDSNDRPGISVNPPVLCKRKLMKKRKKAKLLRQQELERLNQKVEKKKISDIYRLRLMEREINEKEQHAAEIVEKKKIKKDESLSKTKLLGPYKYKEPLLPFQREHEMKKNLRLLKPEGSLLTDRYYSLQKRNVIEPRKKVPRKVKKVKRVLKPGHKEEYTKLMDMDIFERSKWSVRKL